MWQASPLPGHREGTQDEHCLTFSLLLAVQGASRTTKPLEGALDSSWAGGFMYTCRTSLSTTSASCGHRWDQLAVVIPREHPPLCSPCSEALGLACTWQASENTCMWPHVTPELTYSSSKLRMWSMASSTFSGSPVTVTQLGSGAPLCGKRMSTWKEHT